MKISESLKRTDIVLGSTEPDNYRGSYTTASKEIVEIEIEIGMYESARIIITGTITIESVTTITTTTELLLLKLTVSEEKGGLRTNLCYYDKNSFSKWICIQKTFILLDSSL